MTPAGTAEAVEIMERALAPTSRLSFARPSGWQSGAEVRWALDRHFRPCDPDDPKRIAAGTIDLIEWDEAGGRVVVTDEKTTKGWQGHDDLYHEFQPRLYSLWAIENYGVRSVRFRYRNLRHGYAVSDEFHRDGSWFEATKARVLALRAEREVAVEMDAWPETLGPDCAWCPVKHRCAAMAEAARQGRKLRPDLTIAERARRLLAIRALESDYEADVKAHLAVTEEPIDLGSGIAFGLKPVSKMRLVARFADGDGTVSPAQRAALMEFLRGYRMTPEQEAEWFLFCRASDLPAAVKRAVHELLGREAGKFLDDPLASPLEPVTRHEMSAWLPTTGKRPKTDDLEDLLDAAFA